MKKLLTLFLLSFLAVNILAQDRSQFQGTDFYAKMMAAKDAEKAAQVQFDDCFPAVSYPPVCDACGTYRVWLYEDFDCSGAYCDPNLAAGELGTLSTGWYFDHLWDTQFINLYDQRLRNLDVADTTTFNYYDDPISTADKYSWWLGGNWPSFDKPGYDDNWGVYVETNEVLNLQPGLDQAKINFFSWYALEPDVDYVWFQISPRQDILDKDGHQNWYFVDKLFDEIQQRYSVDLKTKYPIEQYTWGNEDLADIENTAKWDPSVFPEIKRPKYNQTSVDVSFLVDEQSVMDYFKNVEGYKVPQFFKFRWVFISDAGNAPATTGYFNGRPGGFWMDEITLLRDGFPQLIDDGGDIRLGMTQALYYQEDNFYWNSNYTSECDKEVWPYYVGAGEYCYGKGDTDYLDNAGKNISGGCGDIVQGGSHKLANGHRGDTDALPSHSTNKTEWLQWPLTTADVFNPGSYDVLSTDYLYKHGTLGHPFSDFDSKARDWDVNCNTSSPIAQDLYVNKLYGYEPYCTSSNTNSLYHPDFPFRHDYAYGPAMSLESLENFLDPGDQNIIRNEYHRWCMTFDFKTLGWEVDNARGTGNLGDNNYVRDYFAIWLYPAKSKSIDPVLIWKSGSDKSTAATSNLTALVDANGNTVKDYLGNAAVNGWVRSANVALPDWIYTEDFKFVVEYYTNPNPWRGKLFVDNIRLIERWDTYEGVDNLQYTTNDTPVLAKGTSSVPGNSILSYDASDPCDEIGYITTCAALHPEIGGLNYPAYDEDYYYFEGEAGDWVDIWVDNSDVDLEMYLLNSDLVVLWDPLQGGQFAYNDGFLYDRIIWELPETGGYYIHIGASSDLPNWKDARGWYTLQLHGTKVAPAFLEAADVPNDQGLQVRLEWCPSYFDTKCAPQWWTGYYTDARIEKYVIWRNVSGDVWDNVVEVYSGLLNDVPETYSYVAPTLKDGAPPFVKFRVSAHMFNGRTFFSDAIQVFSLDNLAPAVTLAGTLQQYNVNLLWQVDIPEEIETFKLYRGTTAGVTPTNGTLLGEFSKSTFQYTDMNLAVGTYYYMVEGLDNGGNTAMSNEVDFDIVSVEPDQMPTEFNLAQNYPNPFNPTTVIKYGLPMEATVTVKVFDVLGQEVVTLVNSQIKNAGYYTINFDASQLKSGMYIYRISAQGIDGSNFVDVKKMLLVK